MFEAAKQTQTKLGIAHYKVEQSESKSNKRKFSDFNDTVDMQTNKEVIAEEEEDILCWSGPKKPRRSPLKCT
jgi:hypothetical protein